MGCLLLLELLTSRFPFFAIAQSGLLPYLSIAEIAVVFYTILKLMWLKFLVMWRFFRLWALVDGLSPPENMTRCMSNNRSLEAFWRGWHSSYNKWLVRYIYRPCGGRASRLWSVWVIFLFVALWHDIELKLLLWGLLNAFFLVVEVYAKHVAATSTVMQSLPASLLQMVAVLSGSTYILVLIAVNLIGYSVGMGSITVVMQKVLTYEGAQVLVVSYYFLCVGVKLMMFIEELREVKRPREVKAKSS
jgi:D-alanyl-lipoteichoic acid acyltransferase DltB (MBOAT superfamily)